MVGCSLFVAMVLALAALAVALRAQRKTEQLERELADLRIAMAARPAARAEERPSDPQPRPAAPPAPAVELTPMPTFAPPPPPQVIVREAAPQAEFLGVPRGSSVPRTDVPRNSEGPEAPEAPEVLGELTAPSVAPKPPFDWESLIGVRLFSWIAGIALVLAMIFLMKYGVEHGWLRPAVRAAIGMATGIALLIVCEMRIARGYAFTANAMHGAGIAILYATLFALHGRWHLWPAWAAFLGMLLVTAAAVYLSVRRDSVFIALLGLIGGFATPALLSSGENRPIALFSYLLLLNGGISWIAFRKRWPLLTALSLILTVIYQWSWVATFLSTGQLPLAATVFILFAAVGLASLLRETEKPFERIATLGAALPLLFAFFTAIVPEYGARYNVLFGFLLLVTSGLAAIALWRGPEWLHTLGGAATAVTFFIWLSASYTHNAFPEVLLWLGAFVVLYLAVGTRLRTIAVQTAGVLFFVLIGLAMHEPFAYALQLTTMFVLLAVVAAYAIRYENQIVFLVALTLSSALVGGMDDAPATLRLAAILGVAAMAAGVYAMRSRFVHAAYVALFLASVVATVTGASAPAPPFAMLMTTHAVILLGILGVAWTSEHHELAALSLFFTLAALFANDPDSPQQQLLFAFVFYALYVLYALLLGARVKKSLLPHIAAAVASAMFFFCAQRALEALGYHDVIGLLPLSLAAVMVLLLWRLVRINAEQMTRLAIVAGTALAFITAAVPLQLENEWITVSWALEAAALAWLFRRIPHRGLVWWSAGLAAAVFVRLVINSDVFAYHPRSATPIVNWYLYAYVLCAAALYLAAYFYPERLEVRMAVNGFATIILFVLLNIEIADFYAAGPALTFNFLSSSLAQELTYTIAWALFAIVMLVIGIAWRMRGARVAALMLLVVTILKCFLHDLGRLGGLYRVASLFGLAVSLVLVGILLQRFVMPRQRVEPDAG